MVRTVWSCLDMKNALERNKRRKGAGGRRLNHSKVNRTLVGDQFNGKKLRRVPHKSSIRVNDASELDNLQREGDFVRTTRPNSKREMLFSSDRKVKLIESGSAVPRTKEERDLTRRTKKMIMTVKTEKGYRLVKTSAIEHINGIQYN